MDQATPAPTGAEPTTPEAQEAPAKPAYRSRRFERAAPEGETAAPEPKEAEKGPEVAPDGGETEKKEAAPKEDRASTKVKLKIHGKEIETDLEEDFPGIKKVWKDYDDGQRKKFLSQVQKMKAADKSLEETAITKKQATALIQALQTNAFSVLEDPRIVGKEKLREKLEEYLYENFIKLEQMDPKERELFEVKNKLKLYEEEKKKEEAAVKEREMAEMTNRYQADYQKQISEALDVAGLPKSALTVQRTAYYLKQALDRGHKLQASQVMDLVKADFQRWFKDMYDTADGDKLIALFGEDVAEKINKARLTKLKGAAPAAQTGEKREEGPSPPRQKFKSLDEWRERNRQRKLQGK